MVRMSYFIGNIIERHGPSFLGENWRFSMKSGRSTLNVSS